MSFPIPPEIEAQLADVPPDRLAEVQPQLQARLLEGLRGGLMLGWGVAAYAPSQMLQDHNEQCMSSVSVVVTASTGEQVYGRLKVYQVDDRGTGPAGRGDYFIQVPDSQIAATSGGRTALAYESYLTLDGLERYAWAIWLNERQDGCP